MSSVSSSPQLFSSGGAAARARSDLLALLLPLTTTRNCSINAWYQTGPQTEAQSDTLSSAENFYPFHCWYCFLLICSLLHGATQPLVSPGQLVRKLLRRHPVTHHPITFHTVTLPSINHHPVIHHPVTPSPHHPLPNTPYIRLQLQSCQSEMCFQ